MVKRFLKGTLLILAMALCFSLLAQSHVHADDSAESTDSESSSQSVPGTNISLSPVSKLLQLSSSSEYEESFSVSNDGDSEMMIEVYAAPYSYVYSEAEDAYKLGFNNDNNYTQITRWITFKDDSGNWVKKPTFTIPPKSSIDVHYKVSTPENIPAGGQYAVIFAHTLTGVAVNGIKTEASPGLVLYGRSTEGEATILPVISDLKISQSVSDGAETSTKINASAKVKNDGNVDFSATGKLTVDGILGGAHYETPSNGGRVSVIPESELVVSDTWDDTPGFGIFKVVWTVKANDTVETIEQVVVINPMPLILIAIILLTIIIIWIILVVRKRKERRSRLAI